MFHRAVSLVLMPCVLMTQSAVLGHSHGGREPAGHDLRPHFHTQPTSVPGHHAYGHHHHGPGSHHHHHHDDGDDAPEPLSEQDHDSDAVYISSVDVVINGRSAVDEKLAASLLWATAECNLPTALWANPPRAAAQWPHPPPPSVCSCPLYVWHLALLI